MHEGVNNLQHILTVELKEYIGEQIRTLLINKKGLENQVTVMLYPNPSRSTNILLKAFSILFEFHMHILSLHFEGKLPESRHTDSCIPYSWEHLAPSI